MARVSEDQVRKAVNALLKWKKLQSKKIPSEKEVVEDNYIYLQLTLKKIPSKEFTNPHKIPLPHPFEAFSNICLIIDDRPRKAHMSKTNLYAETPQKKKPHMLKTKLNVETVQKKIKAEGIPVTKVLKFSKLKSDYKSFEAKRDLYGSYELFLADERVINLLPGVLGKQFYKKKRKVPVPVDLSGDSNWKEEIENACGSSLLCLGSGTCSVVKVGWGGMESSEVMENVLVAIGGIVRFVPMKWGGVRAFHLKFFDSLALPVYEVLPDGKLKTEGASNDDKNLKKNE